MNGFSESLYRAWLSMLANKNRIPYDPDSPYYDYRQMFYEGKGPVMTEHGHPRWPDEGKRVEYDHETGTPKVDYRTPYERLMRLR